MFTRQTRQKEYVLENLKQRFDHPTALLIFHDAQQHGIKIGEVSIYRILNNLVKEGKVCKIVTKDNVAHFDLIREDHIHLVCNCCNRIFDRELDNDKHLSNLIKDFQISKQDIVLHGICKDCAKILNDKEKE